MEQNFAGEIGQTPDIQRMALFEAGEAIVNGTKTVKEKKTDHDQWLLDRGLLISKQLKNDQKV